MNSLHLHRLRVAGDGPTHSAEFSAGVHGIILDTPFEVELLGAALLGISSAQRGRILWSGVDPGSSPEMRRKLLGVLPEEDLASCPSEILARFGAGEKPPHLDERSDARVATRATREALLKNAVVHHSKSGDGLIGLVLCAPFDFEEEAASVEQLLAQNPELIVVYLGTTRRELLLRTKNCVDLRKHPTIAREQNGLRVIVDRPRELLRGLSQEPSLLGFFENPERPRELLLWSSDPETTLKALQKSILRSEIPVHEITSFSRAPQVLLTNVTDVHRKGGNS